MSKENKEDKAIYRTMIYAPIDVVWSHLVATDTVLPFFFGAVCKTPGVLEKNAPMAMQTKDGKYASAVGNVTEFNPPHRYAHSFKFTAYDDEPCTVIYDLKEVDGGTEFTLTTMNVTAGSKTEKGMAQGGSFIVNTLKSMAENGKPSFGTRFLLGIMGLMTPFTPKKCRIENWSFDKIAKL